MLLVSINVVITVAISKSFGAIVAEDSCCTDLSMVMIIADLETDQLKLCIIGSGSDGNG